MTFDPKEVLLAKKKELEAQLTTVGHKEVDGEWEPSPEVADTSATEPDEVADREEAFEANGGIEIVFEEQLRDVDAALARVEEGTYGICMVCNNPIEEERLEINPAATTCAAHAE